MCGRGRARGLIHTVLNWYAASSDQNFTAMHSSRHATTLVQRCGCPRHTTISAPYRSNFFYTGAAISSTCQQHYNRCDKCSSLGADIVRHVTCCGLTLQRPLARQHVQCDCDNCREPSPGFNHTSRGTQGVHKVRQLPAIHNTTICWQQCQATPSGTMHEQSPSQSPGIQQVCPNDTTALDTRTPVSHRSSSCACAGMDSPHGKL
jgi:hypothetical protein